MYKSRYMINKRRKQQARVRVVFVGVIFSAAMLCACALGGRLLSDRLFDKPDISSPTMTVEEAKADKSVTRQIVFEKYIYHAVQTGAFSEENTAIDASKAVKSVGGAGYVLDDIKYRVLACAYFDSSKAQEVKDRLNKNGIESYIYSNALPSFTINATAPGAVIDGLEGTGTILFSSLEELSCLADQVDTNTLSAGEVLEACKNINKRLKDSMDAINEYKALLDENGLVLDGLCGVFQNLSESLDKICSFTAPDAMALSALMRYNVIDTIIKYDQFTDSLSNADDMI